MSDYMYSYLCTKFQHFRPCSYRRIDKVYIIIGIRNQACFQVLKHVYCAKLSVGAPNGSSCVNLFKDSYIPLLMGVYE